MDKKLTEMSLEELWRLFPIFLIEHKAEWSEWFTSEMNLLNQILNEHSVKRISHIGSTAIHGIWAKPIIDILAEVDSDSDIQKMKDLLEINNYICMSESKMRMSFNKGYTKNGFADKVYHLHLRIVGDNDELFFRDYLNEHHETAIEYEKLKIELWKQFEYNRDAYTKQKTSFVTEITKKAKKEFCNRYD